MGTDITPPLTPPLFYRMDIHARYLNPLSDFGFKKLFGEEPNKDILISFLNDILSDTAPIVDLQYMQSEQLGFGPEERKGIYDLYCTTDSGEHFIVELQRDRQPYFVDRAVFYSSYLIQTQGKRGDWDFRLKPVYTICLMNFGLAMYADTEQYVHHVVLKDGNNKVFSDKIRYLFIELSKFEKSAEQLTTQMDKWLYLFRHMSNLEERPAALRERVFDKMFEISQVGRFSRAERHAYEVDLKHHRDHMNIMRAKLEDGLKQGLEKGLKQGHEEGFQQGIERGIEQGIERGIEQGIERGIEQGIERGMKQGVKNSKLAIARAMLASGELLEKVLQFTGLTAEDLKE